MQAIRPGLVVAGQARFQSRTFTAEGRSPAAALELAPGWDCTVLRTCAAGWAWVAG